MIDPVLSIRYMIAGYSVILIVLGLYLASLFNRWRSLKRDLKMLDELENK